MGNDCCLPVGLDVWIEVFVCHSPFTAGKESRYYFLYYLEYIGTSL